MMGDMREIPFEGRFDTVINVGTSFGFLNSEDEDRRVIRAVAKALRSEGVFLLEMGNRDYYLKNFRAKDWHRLEDGRVILTQHGVRC